MPLASPWTSWGHKSYLLRGRLRNSMSSSWDPMVQGVYRWVQAPPGKLAVPLGGSVDRQGWNCRHLGRAYESWHLNVLSLFLSHQVSSSWVWGGECHLWKYSSSRGRIQGRLMEKRGTNCKAGLRRAVGFYMFLLPLVRLTVHCLILITRAEISEVSSLGKHSCYSPPPRVPSPFPDSRWPKPKRVPMN